MAIGEEVHYLKSRMATYDEQTLAARQTLDAHENLVKEIVRDIVKHRAALTEDDEEDSDYRPILKEYARSKQVNTLLIESKVLFDDVVPSLLRNLVGDSQDLDTEVPESFTWDESSGADRHWLTCYEAHFDTQFRMYSHAEFVKLTSNP
jgi:hypothetical protein